MILGMGVAYGGIAQVIAGIQEWKKGNTFGRRLSLLMGCSGFSLVALIMFPGTATDKTATAAYFFMWGLFTLVMFIGNIETEQGTAGCFRHAIRPFLSFDDPRCHLYQRSGFLQDNRENCRL